MQRNAYVKDGWADFLLGEEVKDYFKELTTFLYSEYKSGTPIYPPENLVFNAFNHVDIDDVKCVIVGQDPYHNPNEAMGLSFSVPIGVRIPKSLQNIYKELNFEYGYYIPNNGDLTPWADQGVLLLNSVLTVRKNAPGSHANKGWEVFTDNVIRELNKLDKPIVYMLWGNYAKEKGKLITNPHHLKLEAAHPSPFSARNGFFGCDHFKKCNEFLIALGKKPINWQITDTYI